MAETEGRAWAIGVCEKFSGPVEGDTDFSGSSLNDDDIWSSELGELFGVSVIVAELHIKDSVLCSGGSGVGEFVEGGDVGLYFLEGTVEFVLFAETEFTDEVKMAGVAGEGNA